MTVFFRDEAKSELLTLLLKFITGKSEEAKKLTPAQRNNVAHPVLNEFIVTVCASMAQYPDLWDTCCQINIDMHGKKLINAINTWQKEKKQQNLNEVISWLFGFVVEFELKAEYEEDKELSTVKKKLLNNRNQLTKDSKERVECALSGIPIYVMEEFVKSEEAKNIINFEQTKEKFKQTTEQFEQTKQEIEKLTDDWNSQLTERQNTVEILKNTLDEQKDAFNFVGLNDGFRQLAEDKKEEKKNIKFWLKIMRFLLVSPLVLEIVYILFHLENIEQLKGIMLLLAVPTISLMVILIYYFRILLQDYKSIQSQLLQLDLRMTLCQFIQNYAEYAKELKEKDGASLDKFENIIFSGIMANSEAIPSTFDGVEQLSKLIKATKG